MDVFTAPHPQPKPRTVAGISGLVVAAIALGLSWLPIVNNLAFVLALFSGALATIGLVATRPSGQRSARWAAATALVLSVLSVVVVLSTQALYGKVLDEVSSGLQEGTRGADAVAASDAGATAGGSEAAASSAGAALPEGSAGIALPEGTARFGSTVTFSDRSTLTCAKPVPFRRDRYAVGGEKAAAHLKSRCTFTNRSAKTFEPGGTTGSMSAGGVEGESVYQPGLDSPDNPVLPGRSVSWWMGYGIPSASGVQLTVRLGFLDYDPVTFV